MFIKSIDNHTLVLNEESSNTFFVDDLKKLVAYKESFDVDALRLLFAGRQLEDGVLLSEYGIDEESTIHVDLRLIGGGKKRKKKQYTGPKKQKHVRKKVKLAVLKLYKIDDNGKIQRQRLECTSATCGAGIFMAKHKDRFYCGKCHTTLAEKK